MRSWSRKARTPKRRSETDMAKGRPPKPTFLKLLDGNPGKRPLNTNEPKPVGNLLDPPACLSQSQRTLWIETISEAPAGLLKLLDGKLFLTWVIAADMYHRAVDELNANPALLSRTRNGEFTQNPYISLINKQALMMHRAGELMGFSPSSRTRIAVNAVNSSGDNPFNKFVKR